ncbi:MAG: membrane-bound lytic murein transglycosylase F [Motiliproteus sp.]|jgi:membrane-bound lytic murein transglycosylase F
MRKLPLLIGTGLALSLVPVISEYAAVSQLDTIQARHELRVATRLSPTTYYVEGGQPGGFEYELALAYADYIGVTLKLLPLTGIEEITEALRLNNAHFAAAGLSRTPERARQFDFAPSYLDSQMLLIYRSGAGLSPPESLQQIDSPIRVVARSNHMQYLQRLQDPPPWAEAEPEADALDLLRAVDQFEIDYTLADSEAFRVSQPFFPRLKSAFAVSEPQPVAWMLKQGADTSLRQSLGVFFGLNSTQALILSLKERHFDIDHRLNLVDNLTFRTHLRARLPALRAWFEQAAAEQEMQWELLAAIGYQESHWNPKAVSPTGVRGVMMLTRNTAKAMEVNERTDPKQSIFGGARYIQRLRERVPERIAEPDHTWFALAAYNVGRGHLEDARILTQAAGDNPDLWNDVARHLPKLAQARWYNDLKYGYARGYEPVKYVQNIQRYLTMLKLESRYEAIQRGDDEDFIGPPVPSILARPPFTL